MRRVAAIAVLPLLLVAACGGDDDADTPATTTTTTPASTTSTTTAAEVPVYGDHVPDLYAGTENWICHPDLPADECTDIRTTVIAPDGSRTVDDLAPADDPAFDCFYVYPTTSADPGPNSDLEPDESEIDTVRAQVARYSSVCRVFAPVYRQITLQALGGGADADDRALAYADVVDAWRTYAVEHNDGRPVALIGHSQGAGHLTRLVAEEIDPEPALRDILLSAILLGSSVAPDQYENIPPCETAQDVACVISYSSYPAPAPPVDGAIFGRLRDTGAPALCVSPADVLGDDGVVDAIVPTRLSLLGGIQGFEDVDTPFVELTDAARIACAETNGYGYLAIDVASPDDPRPVGGLLEQRLGPTWGLHLLDANVGQNELIELVASQAEAHGG